MSARSPKWRRNGRPIIRGKESDGWDAGEPGSGMSPLRTTGTLEAATISSRRAVSQTPAYICSAVRAWTARKRSGKSLIVGMSASNSSGRDTPSRALTEKRPGPITSQPTSSIRRRTSGVRSRPLPRPLLRTIGNGHPQLRSAVS